MAIAATLFVLATGVMAADAGYYRTADPGTGRESAETNSGARTVTGEGRLTPDFGYYRRAGTGISEASTTAVVTVKNEEHPVANVGYHPSAVTVRAAQRVNIVQEQQSVKDWSNWYGYGH